MGICHRTRGPCAGGLLRQAVFRGADRLRRGPQHPGQPRRCRHAGHAAGHQPGLHRAGGADRPRLRRRRRPSLGVRPQELLLSGPAAGLPDIAIHAAHRVRRVGGDSRSNGAGHPPAPGAGRRQERSRPGPGPDPDRPEPRRRGAHGDRERAGPAEPGRGGRFSHAPPRAPALARHLRRQHAGGVAALRRQCVGAPSRRRARHADGDQEPQLDPLPARGHRIRGAAPGRGHRRRRGDRAGDAALRPGPGRNPGHAHQGRRA